MLQINFFVMNLGMELTVVRLNSPVKVELDLEQIELEGFFGFNLFIRSNSNEHIESLGKTPGKWSVCINS